MTQKIPLVSDWHGCYADSWKGVIVDEAFSHPAKFAYGLITRIVEHGLKQGYWNPGELVGDPFGGVALGGVICGARGLNWIGVELEQTFVDIGNRNLEKHGPLFMHSGATCVKLVQGDSREFAKIVGEVDGVVCSPPFSGTEQPCASQTKELQDYHAFTRGDGTKRDKISTQGSPGQIGALKIGSLSAVISSPPFADSVASGEAARKILIDNYKTRDTQSTSQAAIDRLETRFATDYGTTPGNIGNLKAGELTGIVTSPPWQDSLDRGVVDKEERRRVARSMGISNAEHISPIELEKIGKRNQEYGATDGQIGNDKGESYWQAMQLVYAQCYQAIKPGGVIAVVVKDFVKAGERVPLCDQTAQLLESCGFTVFERTLCHLVKTTTERSLFGEDIVTTKSRKSFFRRLAEKNGSPEINHEEGIWAKKLSS